MNRNMKIYTVAALLVLAVTACEKEVVIDTGEYKPKLVYNCLFDNLHPMSGEVSGSVKALSLDDPQKLTNAAVELYDYLTFKENLNYNAFSEKYEGTLVAQPGKTYRTVVKHPGYDDIVGVTTIPDLVNINGSQFVDTAGYDENGAPYSTYTIRFNDNVSAKNYYRLELYYFDNFSNKWWPLNFTSDDAALNEEIAIYLSSSDVVFTDASFNGKQKDIKVRFLGVLAQGSPRFMIHLSHLSADAYKYLSKSNDEWESEPGLFSEPVIIYSNMTNGLGVFAGRSITADTIH